MQGRSGRHLQQAIEKLLRNPPAALCAARSLAYLFDMSRSLRCARLASGLLATFFDSLHNSLSITPGFPALV